MTIREEVEGYNPTFQEGGGLLKYVNDSTIGCYRLGQPVTDGVRFRVPLLLDANENRLPGWFLAGIWDYMNLHDLASRPDAQLLSGWGFHAGGLGLWQKPLAREANQVLVYRPATGELLISNPPQRVVRVGLFPAKSPFHAIKMFEEQGLFKPSESSLPSLEFRDYVIKEERAA